MNEWRESSGSGWILEGVVSGQFEAVIVEEFWTKVTGTGNVE